MKVLLILDAEGGHVSPSDLRCVTAASKISQDVDIFVFCPKDVPGVHILQNAIGGGKGTNTVYCCPLSGVQYRTAEHMTPTLLSVCKHYSHILSSATSFGKNLLPRLAALLDVGMISDVISILGPRHFKRPIYAGNAIAEIITEDPFVVATIRTTAFDMPSFNPEMQDAKGKVEEVTHVPSPLGQQVMWISLKAETQERPDLASAAVVVAGGRALGSQEGFQLI